METNIDFEFDLENQYGQTPKSQAHPQNGASIQTANIQREMGEIQTLLALLSHWRRYQREEDRAQKGPIHTAENENSVPYSRIQITSFQCCYSQYVGT